MPAACGNRCRLTNSPNIQMKSIFLILLTAGMLCTNGNAFASPPDSVSHALTRQVARELGLGKEEMARLEEINQERIREIRIATIVYKNHPIMREAKVREADKQYQEKLRDVLRPEQFKAFIAMQ